MSSVNLADKLTGEQRAIIRRGALEQVDWRKVHEDVSLIKPVTQNLVRKLMADVASELSIKSEAKLEGARIVHEFLKKAKKGLDVEEMSAVLEQALYRDILRRYADAGDALVSMTMGELFKLEMSYRSARLARQKRETDIRKSGEVLKLSARVCVETIEKLGSILDDKTRLKIMKMKKPLLDWAASEYGKENVNEILNEKNEIDRLASLMGKRRSSVNSKGTPGAKELVGLAG